MEILAARRDVENKGSLQINGYTYNEEQDVDYVKITYQIGEEKETKNLMLHYERYTQENCPYNQIPESTPYVVIKNNVYEISSFTSLGFDDGIIE